MVDERLRALARARFPNVREHRYEGLLEGPFGEEPAQHVGEAESDVEGVGFRARAEIARDQHVADHPGDTGDEREAGYGGGGLQ